MPKGIVISNVSNLYNVEISEDVIYKCNARGKFKNEEISPVAGDIVQVEILDEQNKLGVISQIVERKNYIKRPKMSNLSQLILVISMKLPKPDLELLDKQLAYAEYMNVEPIIDLNKIDLVSEEIVDDIYNVYSKIGYKVIKTNAKDVIDVENIKMVLSSNVAESKEIQDAKITAFSGNSGVGKSTLINSLLNKNITQEGEISDKNKRGKNTTTQVQLYKVENNSYIADTPGFSTFDIYEIESIDLCRYFREFNEHIQKCEFGGCSHVKEQNCGIKLALEQGKISKGRYERYCKIYKELKEKEEKKYK